jgi:ABC-2 type transport system permease protein
VNVRGTIAVARGVAWRQLHNALTNPSYLLPSLAFPLLNFAAFAGGLARVRQVPGFTFAGSYTTFQYVFVLLQSAAFSGVFSGFGVARDFETGFTRRLLLAAPNRTGLVIGYALASAARWIVTASIVTVVAFAVGMTIGGNGVDLFGLYLLAVIFNQVGLLWAAGVAMRIRTIQAGPLMQTPVFLALFLAPVYVPLDVLSGWIHGVARLNPLTFLIEAGRGFIDGNPTQVVAAFSIAFAMLILFAIWARTGLARAERAG